MDKVGATRAAAADSELQSVFFTATWVDPAASLESAADPASSAGVAWADDEGPPQYFGPAQLASVVFLVSLPSVLVVVFLSDVGIGLAFYNSLAPERTCLAGDGVMALACLACCGLYVADWRKWAWASLRAAAAGLVILLVCLAACLKCRDHPEAPLVAVLAQVLVAIGALRVRFWRVKHSLFWTSVSASLFLAAAALLLVWLLWMHTELFDGRTHEWNVKTKALLVRDSENMYRQRKVEIGGEHVHLVYHWDCAPATKREWHCPPGRGHGYRHFLGSRELDERAQACAKVATTWFLVWLSPFIAALVNLTVCLFIAVCGVRPARENLPRLEKALKWFIFLVCAMVLVMWVAASIAGASMRLTSTILAFCGAGIFGLCTWIYLELKPEVTAMVRYNERVRSLVALVRSDWFWAMAILGLNVLMPAALALDALKQRLRKLRGLAKPSDPPLTPWVHHFMGVLQRKRWASVLSKVNILCEIYFALSIVVAKVTIVFLSWLNEWLLALGLTVVVSLFFVVGFLLFLAPPVPGIPVYICAGIVITARAKQEDFGFGPGILLAVVVSFWLKLAAVVGQYMIGYLMGKSVKIQQLVRVDKVATRAVERILQQPGCSLPKVAVLVGGPDWPTSVLCGILRLNLFQCILGTTPVIFVSSPCVVAGALMLSPSGAPGAGSPAPAQDGGSQEAIWDALAGTSLGISAIVQLASGLLALYFIQEVAFSRREELAARRPEHDAVLALTSREAAYLGAYAKATEWSRLCRLPRLLLLLSTGLMLLSVAYFVFMDKVCFRPFHVSSSIGASFDEGGLDNSVQNLVLWPGRVAVAVFMLALVLHLAFLRWADAAAKKQLSAPAPES